MTPQTSICHPEWVQNVSRMEDINIYVITLMPRSLPRRYQGGAQRCPELQRTGRHLEVRSHETSFSLTHKTRNPLEVKFHGSSMMVPYCYSNGYPPTARMPPLGNLRPFERPVKTPSAKASLGNKSHAHTQLLLGIPPS